jgi:hypothetical protein
VALRRRLGARGKVKNEYRDKIAAALEMHQGAIDAEARPGRCRDRAKIDAEVFGDGHPLIGRPAGIRIEQHFRMREIDDRLVHERHLRRTCNRCELRECIEQPPALQTAVGSGFARSFRVLDRSPDFAGEIRATL